MLHEILLSLSGHPSPLLRSAEAPGADVLLANNALISPPERELLRSVSHLSDLHIKLLSFGAQVCASHPSMICRAVATAVENIHLAAFQRKILEVEASILRKDAGLVGAYDMVPLTAVVSQFVGWTRRMDWLWDTVQFMLRREGSQADGAEGKLVCTGAAIMDRLRGELKTGYVEVEETARSLIRVAETAWVKQVSAWLLYGRLPGFGADDFFIQASDTVREFACIPALLPSFVLPPTAASILFIGRSLNHVRTRSRLHGSSHGIDHLSSQLRELSALTYPLHSASFSRRVTNIRLFLSRNTLQKLLPLSRVLEMLHLLRDFLLLGRGEFAMSLAQQADHKIRNRWRTVDQLNHEKGDGSSNVVIKEGEVMAVLSRTWAAMGSMQGYHHMEEDEGLELARDLLRLAIVRSEPSMPARLGLSGRMAPTPFRNLMLSVPVILTVRVPSPLDLFLGQSDVQVYSTIHSYLHSIRRAHLRLTDLWKIPSLRRHHPPPPKPVYGNTPAGRAHVAALRGRQDGRMLAMRSAWATCSAAIFFLAELEGYLQIEVVAELWDGFRRWLVTGSDEFRPPEHTRPSRRPSPTPPEELDVDAMDEDDDENRDVWLAEAPRRHGAGAARGGGGGGGHPHDPQTLAAAHRLYLYTLIRRLLLSHQDFTDALYNLLGEVDKLVALVYRLQDVWNSVDLDEDMGVVDAFVDLESEERTVKGQIKSVEGRIKTGIEGVIAVLRQIEADREDLVWGGNEVDKAGEEGEDGEGGESGLREEGQYVPRRVGGVDRLLMKLDFGSWFGR